MNQAKKIGEDGVVTRNFVSPRGNEFDTCQQNGNDPYMFQIHTNEASRAGALGEVKADA